MDTTAPVHEARSHGHRIGRSRGFCWFARFGIAARGVVYVVIGVLAIKLALGDGGKATDQQGALQTIAKQPLGGLLLALVAAGLLGYASWRLLRAALGGTHGQDDLKDRVDGLASGIAYGILFAAALKILVGAGGGGGANPDDAAGGVLGWPGGPWLVGIVGAVVIGVGLQQGYKGVTRSFMEKTDTGRMHEGVEHAYTAFGVFGHLARMAVFCLIGWFLIKAAIDFDPHEAVALDGALAKVAHSEGGPLLLGLVAAGLIGFGAFSLVESRYRRV
ncbi:MAG TPA: DUF1206 domain-containing protein [Solirubrobacteraceae bacterium]|nr:DUF1206 domain-containing protein [Solirubrobacteraceae bacterium]